MNKELLGFFSAIYKLCQKPHPAAVVNPPDEPA